jgi:hypothetical protein
MLHIKHTRAIRKSTSGRLLKKTRKKEKYFITYKQHCKPTTTNMTAMRNFECIILSNRSNKELMFKTKIHATDKQGSSFVPNSLFIVVHCYLCLFVYLSVCFQNTAIS